MSSPFSSSEVKRLADELARMQGRLAVLEGGLATSGAGYMAFDGRPFVVKDDSGVVRQVHGLQSDGTYTTTDVNGPVPATPVSPIVEAIPGGLRVTWSGAFVGGAAVPTDLRWVEIHIDQDPGFTVSDSTRDAAVQARSTITFATDDYVPHTVRLVARSTSGVSSAPSGSVTATPLQLRAGDIGPNEVGTVQLDDGAVSPPKSGTGVTANLVPDPGFNDAGWRVKRTQAPWSFVEASSVGFFGADWAAFCPPTTTRAVLTVTGSGQVPVIPGESYFIAYDVARSAAGAGLFGLEVSFTDSTGATVLAEGEEADEFLIEVRSIASLPTDTFAHRDGQIIVPPGAANMRVVMVRDDEVGTSAGNLFVDRVEIKSVVTRASSGQRVETSPSGMIVFDGNGQAIGSVNSDAGLTMVAGSFNDSLTYQGTEVGDLFDQRARGEVARVDAGAGTSPATTSEVVWLEFEFAAKKGRAYKLRSSGLTGRSGPTTVLRVRYTTDGTRPLITSPQLVNVSAVTGQTVFLASDLGALADGGDIARVRLFLDVVSGNGSTSSYFDPADPALGFSAWVEDTGPRPAASGGIVTGGTSGGSGSGGSTPTTPTVQTYTKTWVSTWSRSFNAAGLKQNAPIYQGYYDSSNGDHASLFGFDINAVRADLAGSTIKKVEIYLYAEHWYYSSGGNVWLGTAVTGTPPATYPPVNTQRVSWHLNKPEGRWVDLGNVGITIGNEIRDGSTGSFCLDPRPFARNLLDYGRFSGQGAPIGQVPGMRITYEKAT